MKKKYKVSLIALFAALLAVLLLSALTFASRSTVFAADRYVTVDGSNVFYTSIRGAEVTAGKETVKGENNEDEEHYYTLFKIGREETVAYRKSLAYSWKSGVFDDKGNPTGVYEEKNFSMKIGFDSLNFERYIISFQSQQYLKTEDKITENFLVFAPAENGRVSIAAVTSLEDEITSYPVSCSVADNAKLEIAFKDFSQGKVTVEIKGQDVQGSNLEFENVYYPYSSYVSSGDSAVTPLTFRAEFKDDAQPAEGTEELTADMKLYELNGQSFELFAHDSDGIYNDVKDNAPPVMCFTKTPSYVEFGKELDFDFQVIDVLATSPRSTACFYVLTGGQYAATDFNYSQIEYEEKSSEDEEGYEYPFIKVNSGSDIRVIRDAETFVPSKYLEGGSGYSEDYTVYGLIKVYYEISDVTGSSAKTDKVFVDWYAKDEALVNIYSAEYKNDSAKEENFLKIIDGKDGVTYAKDTDTALADYKATIESLQEDYQRKIDEAIAKLEDGKLYAGGDSNFYLPAFDLLDGDEYSNLQDYKYSIYYNGKSSGSSTSLDYNKMSIALSDADVTYRFTVYITDSFGNSMRYPDENGVWQEISTEDIWKEDFADLLPFFEFNVSYKKATAKNPEKLSVSYVGTSYSGVSFDIKDSSNTATANYSLYVFDRNAAYGELGLNLTYSQFVENFDKLFANEYQDGVNTRKYFTTVKPANQLQESDENYELFKAINWNASNVAFTPQSAEDFYIVRLTLTDNRSQTSEVYFATVAASIQANSLKGESDWLENNIAAIILLSVAGVLFIAFIVLLVVKPKDKGDIDEIYENDKKVKKNKKK